MNWNKYYQEYSQKSDREIFQKLQVKEEELRKIFKQIKSNFNDDEIKVAILGCADVRMIKGHKDIFKKLFNKKVELITFDIDVDHLLGDENVVKHDCSKLLPNLPYDIVYSHVLLKFLNEDKQWQVIMSSFESLKRGGCALHLIDKEDYFSADLVRENFFVPIDKWENNLRNLKIRYKKIMIKYGLALIIFKD